MEAAADPKVMEVMDAYSVSDVMSKHCEDSNEAREGNSQAEVAERVAMEGNSEVVEQSNEG
eukprot:1945063-Alexandrium_andersonii.AAC.1